MLRTNVCRYETDLGMTLYILVSLASLRPVPTMAVTLKTRPLALLRVAPVPCVMAAVAALLSDVQLPLVLALVAVIVIVAAVVFVVVHTRLVEL